MQSVTNAKPIGGFYTFTLKTRAGCADRQLDCEGAARRQHVHQDREGGNGDAQSPQARARLRQGRALSGRHAAQGPGQRAMAARRDGIRAQDRCRSAHGVGRHALRPQRRLRLRRPGAPVSRASSRPCSRASSTSKGQATFEQELLPGGEAPGLLSAQFTTRVFEEGGAFSSSQSSVPFYPYPHFVGVKLPKGDQSARHAADRQDAQHRDRQPRCAWQAGVAAESAGHDLQDRVEVVVGQDRRRARAVREGRAHARRSSRVRSRRRTARAASSSRSSIRSGAATWCAPAIPDGGHCTGTVFYIDWPGWAGHAREEGGSGASVLTFSSDKPEYKVGETA